MTVTRDELRSRGHMHVVWMWKAYDASFDDLVRNFLHSFMVDEEANVSLPSVSMYVLHIPPFNK